MTDLDALRALVAKATPGPWTAQEVEPDDGGQPATWAIHAADTSMEATLAELWSGEHDSGACAKLIVAAVNALPVLLDELAAARRDAERGCWWARDGEDSDTWQTKCGHWFTVNEGTPSDNEMQYCPFCAGKIDDTDETDDAARGER